MNFHDEKSLMELWLNSDQEKRARFLISLKLDVRIEALLSVAFCYNIYRRFNKNNKEHKHKEIVEFAELLADGKEDKNKARIFYDGCSSKINRCTSCHICANLSMWKHVPWVYVYLITERNNEKQVLNEGKLITSVVGPGWKFNNEWKTGNTIALSNTIYENKDWSLIPILADALQDAGCEENFLDHMRNKESKFCRGYWVLDQLLGKRK